MIDRTDRVIAALARRLSEQGDMHIVVPRRTFEVMMRALGVWRDFGDEPFREVDALVLDMMIEFALKRQPT